MFLAVITLSIILHIHSQCFTHIVNTGIAEIFFKFLRRYLAYIKVSACCLLDCTCKLRVRYGISCQLDHFGIVYQEMCKRIEQLVIAKHESTKADPETEALRTEIIKVEEDINKLMDRLVDADDVLFKYIQDKVSKLHAQKSELEKKMQTKARKRKAIDTKPLEEPMKHWDELTVQEKHNVAVMMIDVVYVSDENGVEVVFSI